MRVQKIQIIKQLKIKGHRRDEALAQAQNFLPGDSYY